MKVSTNSWFYRQANHFNWEVSNSLCIYFWQVVWGIVFFWFVVPIIAIAICSFILCVVPLALGDALQFALQCELGDTQLKKNLWSLGLGYLVLTTIFLLVFAYLHWKDYAHQHKSEKRDNLILAYLKAKKQKICPIIEFTSGDKE